MNESKVQIGSNYVGIPFDRPCLRQMPREWRLEEERKEIFNWWDGDWWVGIVTVLVGAWALAITLRGFL